MKFTALVSMIIRNFGFECIDKPCYTNRLNPISITRNTTIHSMDLGIELQFTLACFIGFILESICYGKHPPTTASGSDPNLYAPSYIGIYCVIYAAFVRMRLKRTNNGSKALLYLSTANFIACTASLAVDATAHQTNPSTGVIAASNTLYMCNDLILQAILVNFLTYDTISTNDASGFPFSKIYRCWIMWRQPWIMVVPILLTFAFLGVNLHNLH